MPHSFGVRARTRDSFSKAFHTKGIAPLSVFLTPFKRGDYVDIKCDPSQTSGEWIMLLILIYLEDYLKLMDLEVSTSTLQMFNSYSRLTDTLYNIKNYNLYSTH